MGLLDVFKKRDAPKFDLQVEDNDAFVLKLEGSVPSIAIHLALQELAAKGIKYKKSRNIKLDLETSQRLGETVFFKKYLEEVMKDIKKQSLDKPDLEFESWFLASCVFKSTGAGYNCLFVVKGNVKGC